MTWRDDLHDRVADLEAAYGLGDDSQTTRIIVGDSSRSDQPETSIDLDDIRITREHGEDLDESEEHLQMVSEEIVVPHHLPKYYRNGLVIMNYDEVAWCWEHMPDDIRERELEYRLEEGEPIPPILQR